MNYAVPVDEALAAYLASGDSMPGAPAEIEG